MSRCYLVLSTGDRFEGERAGAIDDVIGEMVVDRSAGDYMRVLTDPAYEGKIVLQTFPEIGNYGVILEEEVSGVHPAGYAVRELCQTPSNFRCSGRLEEYLIQNKIAGVCGVDVRHIARIVQAAGGPVHAAICGEVTDDILQKLKEAR